jgi:murein DD-endopeptidase MepM/ murein hydrolase activator NlpD
MLRHRSATFLLGLALAGCIGDLSEQSTPWADLELFVSPTYYTVRRGDTLSAIGKRYGVTVADLRAWNGIDGDLIEVDQVLLVWAAVQPRPTRSTGKSPPAMVVKAARVVVEPATVVVETREPVAYERREMPPLVTTSGVLAVLEGDTALSEELDPELVATLDGLSVHRTERARAVFSERTSSLGRSGTAEATAVPDRLVGDTGPSFGQSSVRAPRLAMPAPRRCLPGPTGVSGEHDISAGKGLTIPQIRTALEGFLRHTATCIPPGSSGTVTISTELTVGCDGRVVQSRVVSGGGAPSPVSSCVAKALTYAGFPAHDLPDGFTFVYPVEYRF